jgi:hypothetical protein
MVDKLNYLKSKLPGILPLLRRNFPEAIPAFMEVVGRPEAYAESLRRMVSDVARKSGLEVEVVF